MSDSPVFTVPSVFSLRPIKPNAIPPERDLIRSAQLLLQESYIWPEYKIKPADASKSAPADIRAFSYTEQQSTESSNTSKPLPWSCAVVTANKEDLSFTSLWSRIGSHPIKSQQRYIPNLTKITQIQYISENESIWNMLYVYPPPLSPRVYTMYVASWLLEYSHRRRGIIVYIPVDLSKDSLLAELEEKGVKGKCAMVEMIQEMEGDKVEWRRLSCNDPGGLLPRFCAYKMAGGRLVEEMGLCLTWIRNLDKQSKKPDKSREGKEPRQMRVSFQEPHYDRTITRGRG
ncbi:hypothetical protein BJ165DRAFT_364787 [Panaeolus papilionaceus]|nr:hypothetical protein BJ165DRAFT_364787 [Panaeolus papilionaceus]